jgi:hypothetical protein
MLTYSTHKARCSRFIDCWTKPVIPSSLPSSLPRPTPSKCLLQPISSVLLPARRVRRWVRRRVRRVVSRALDRHARQQITHNAGTFWRAPLSVDGSRFWRGRAWKLASLVRCWGACRRRRAGWVVSQRAGAQLGCTSGLKRIALSHQSPWLEVEKLQMGCERLYIGAVVTLGAVDAPPALYDRTEDLLFVGL